jgi:hypothetical protein
MDKNRRAQGARVRAQKRNAESADVFSYVRMAEKQYVSGRQRDTVKNVKRGRSRQSLECGHNDVINDKSREEARLSKKGLK